MATINHKVHIPYSVTQMFQLVNNIEAYSDFLPWCKESKIISQSADEVRAMLTLTGGGLQKSFTTCNRLQQDKMIEISLVNGPFRHLEGYWLFHAGPNDSCIIQFNLAFEFSNKLLSLAFSPVFNQVANTLVDAFVKRAADIYDKKESH